MTLQTLRASTEDSSAAVVTVPVAAVVRLSDPTDHADVTRSTPEHGRIKA